MSTRPHKETAQWLLLLTNALGPRERKFVGAMLRMERPSPAQIEWLSRITARAVRDAKKELRHA